MQPMSRLLLLLLLTSLWACSDQGAATGGGPTGSGAGGATASVGGGASEGGGGSTSSGGEGGAGGGGSAGAGGGIDVPLDGFGVIAGACGELDPRELVARSPAFELENAIDFGTLTFSRDVLSPGGQTLFDAPNAGGSSKESEIIAFELLHRCELATLLKTETQIVYDTTGALTDMLVEIDGLKVGVSVVRAFKYMAEYTESDALAKMGEKLADIQESSANVSSADAWDKQILAVIAEKPENAAAVQAALPQIDVATRGDTIVIITVTHGDDAFVY